jgi:pimeloyl-ACP methyl ester carboxylesterase
MEAPVTRDCDVESETAEIAGCKVRVTSVGSGAPLLLLHGTETRSAPTAVVSLLAREFHIVCPDHPGFGRSETPAWLDGIHDLAFFYLDFLAARAMQNVHLVGLGLGGWIAAEVAVRSTERIRTLTLSSPYGLPGQGLPDVFLWTREEMARNAYFNQSFAEADLASPPDDELDAREKYMTARVGWQPRFHDPLLGKWLHRIDRPTQIVWPREDRVVPAANAAVWRSALPRAEVSWIEQCGHRAHIEQPEAFARAVIAFAKRQAQ